VTETIASAAPPIDPALIEGLVRSLVKGIRAVQIYLPNNPVYQQSIENIKKAFEPVWRDLDTVDLEVLDAEIKWIDHVVYREANRSDSLAWQLYKDGIRTISFLPGVEREEVVEFLGIIHKARSLPQDAEDDLLTLLWEADFRGVQYMFVEPGEGEPELGAGEKRPAPSAQVVRETVQQDVSQLEPHAVVNLEDFDSSLYVVEDHEIEYLKRELEREYRHDLRTNVLAMLFDLFELQKRPPVRREIIAILEELIPHYLNQRDCRAIGYILRETGVVTSRAKELLDEERDALGQVAQALSEPDGLDQLLQALDDESAPSSEDDLGLFFSHLRPDAVETAIRWLPRLTNPQIRSILEPIVHRLARANPSGVAKTLAAEEEVVVVTGARLAKWLRLPDVVPELGQLLVHDERDVRMTAVGALGEIGTREAREYLENALDDGDREIRIDAVRMLGNQRGENALTKIEEIVKGRASRAMDLGERLAFYEAFGRIAGSDGIDMLARTLQSRGFMRREDPETRACAAMALGKIGTPEAAEVLERVGDDKEPVVRNAVHKALREIKQR
jgi:HEAT repeat protein